MGYDNYYYRNQYRERLVLLTLRHREADAIHRQQLLSTQKQLAYSNDTIQKIYNCLQDQNVDNPMGTIDAAKSLCEKFLADVKRGGNDQEQSQYQSVPSNFLNRTEDGSDSEGGYQSDSRRHQGVLDQSVTSQPTVQSQIASGDIRGNSEGEHIHPLEV